MFSWMTLQLWVLLSKPSMETEQLVEVVLSLGMENGKWWRHQDRACAYWRNLQ
jgi:hypothetical protein